MSFSKKVDLYRTLRQEFYLSEAPSTPMIPYSPPYTLYTVRVYSILIHTRKGGELTREKVRGAIVNKAGQNTNMTDYISSLLNTSKDDI